MFAAYSGKRILMTGASGYIATNVAALLKGSACHIIRLSRKPCVALNGVASCHDVRHDVRDSEIWGQVLEDIDIVFHLAGQTSVSKAEQNPLADFEINVQPALAMMETCRQKGWRPTVLLAGTATQVGIPVRQPVDESYPDHPITVYDLHKLVAEQYLKYYVSANVVQGACLRLANVYGPGPPSSSLDRGVLNRMVQKALASETLTIYGEGDALRDYVHVEDVARAFLLAALKMDQINGAHFVIGTGEGTTVADAFQLVAETVQQATGREVCVAHVPPPENQSPIDARNFVADPKQFVEATGWTPMYTLAEGLNQTVAEMS